LLINIGTTNEAVARALVRHKELRVITNNLNVAELLARETEFKVIATGGTVRNRDGGLVGQSACDVIDQFRVDIGVIGISGDFIHLNSAASCLLVPMINGTGCERPSRASLTG